MNPLQGHPRYKLIKELNSGTFGQVVLAQDTKSNKKVAVKLMNRGNGVSDYVERELMTHRILNHAHIIKFREAFLTKYHLAVVLEYADGGDMYDYVVSRKRLSENKARWIFQQLVVAVDYLHKMGIACRDIKLENTLLAGSPDKPLVKLCDLGYAKSVDMHSVPNSKVGTPAYLAPEVISSSEYNGMVADIWSCGVMLYVMLVGQYPFERPTDKQLAATRKQQVMIDRILRCDYAIPSTIQVSPECHDLMSKLLVVDPKQRITIPQIQAHPWYQLYLPAGVADMNTNLEPNKSAQSVEELKAIAKAGMQIGGDDAYDDLIDAAVTNA